MNEISCPHCNNAFKIDQAGYADIVKQVREKKSCEMSTKMEFPFTSM